MLQYMEAGGTEPLPHEHGARSAGMRMWGGLREHRVRSNPRCYSIWKQAEQSRSRMSMEHEVRSNPRCYSIRQRAEQSRSRMSMEHEGGDIYENVSHQR
ncbi:hypothetical protein [Eubacterium sp. An11]|uniref:hypothetical protein n=1 Tax=Eubacterium sp. An11 TaxID=1965542 RepID=UPI0013A641C9|nr:hypothetical protein [Eubacterium sp. An11]